MINHARATASIAYMTFLEAIRNRLIMIAFLFAIVLIGLSVAAGSVSLGHRAASSSMWALRRPAPSVP